MLWWHALVSARLLRPGEELPVPTQLRDLPCAAPTRRAAVQFPEPLLDGFAPAIDFAIESGYINVTSEDYLFYLYMGATSSAPANAPLLFWSNGGPGCTAMEGATTEIGALWLWDAKQAGKAGFSGTLSRNPYAWNNLAHLVFVDQPRYVGYSTGTGKRVTSSRDAGLDIVQFLLGWRRTFPEHAGRSIILASESYGGHYVPAWAAAVLDFNEGVPLSETLPLSGLLIGNGIVNETVQSDSFGDYAKAQRLIPQDARVGSDQAARMLVRSSLGYSPNYYDYRLKDLTCCGCTSFDYKEWSSWFLRSEVKEALHVCGTAGQEAFGGCSAGCVSLPHFDALDSFEYSTALSRALDSGVNLTFYYGKQDTACNYVGAFRMANSSLAWAGAAAFRSASPQPLKIAGATVGAVVSAAAPTSGRLTWVEVDGASHMVPMDQGAAASFALQSVLA